MRLDVEGFQQVERLDLGGACAFLAIHAAPSGRSFGGVRVGTYASDDDALDDACRLARAMTRKVLLAGIPAGGAKTVIRLPAGGWPPAARAAGLARLGEHIERLGGLYHCGADLGFTDADETALRATTRHVAARSIGIWTARSVLLALRAVLPEPRSVAIQGLGVVGRGVAEDLLGAGCRVVAADLDEAAGAGLRGLERVAPSALIEADCEVLSPCATGGVIDTEVAGRLRSGVVCGGANNPLADDAAADRLHARGIVYVPDVISNAGAVIQGASEALGQHAQIEPRLAAVADTVRAVLDRSRREDRSPHHVARDMADALLVLAQER